MQEIGSSENERLIAGHWYETNSYNSTHTELLGTDLPFGTADKKFLVGSASYAALPGVPAPDYIVPDGIIDPAGDTVVWWFYQTIDIPPGVMPSDGALSITVVNPAPIENPTYSVSLNSPTNFAGETGSVVLPTGVPALSPSSLLVLAFAAAALGAGTQASAASCSASHGPAPCDRSRSIHRRAAHD